jgi:hypothetical protein
MGRIDIVDYWRLREFATRLLLAGVLSPLEFRVLTSTVYEEFCTSNDVDYSP